MTALLLWLVLLLVALMTAVASSAALRKHAFIWFSYATITGWYYFRVLYKKYWSDNSKDEVTALHSSNRSSSSKSLAPSSRKAVESLFDPHLVYFEPREVVEQCQLEQLERSGSSSLSDSTSSGSYDGIAATPTKHKRRFLRSRKKAAAEEAMRRVSDASSTDLLINSGASESNAPVSNTATRRTYTGRKKPVSWED
ncbi:unnamed protein product [Peronospora destructor]|uniref:Uncharacterized protein n=1 Tax=Peronospora destructor TaxID=86335 RepID=A0AAV0VAQ8_9STRA|nr:unnamed protein product [Peronospora destructor]